MGDFGQTVGEYINKISGDGSILEIVKNLATGYINIIFENRLYVYSLIIGIILGIIIMKVKSKKSE